MKCISLSADELDEAFTELSFIIREYLDLKPPAVADSIQDSNSRVGAGTVSGHVLKLVLSVKNSYLFVTRTEICE